MNRKLMIAALLGSALATPAFAQDATSTSGSGAEANSGSISGASSDNHNANINAGIGTSSSTSNSNSDAVSGSISGSQSNGNEQGQGQTQGQGQSANNTQGQGQDQGQGQSQSNDSNNSSSNSSDQGQMQDQNQSLDSAQANEQGVTVNQTWNTRNRKTTEQRTNQAVPLAASSSFSSDYCGGTVSGGASAAPLGISIGASKQSFDKSCQALRRAEKFGMAAVNAQNMGQRDLSGRLMSMMIWSICTSDSAGPGGIDRPTVDACNKLLLVGSMASVASVAPAQPGKTEENQVRTASGAVTAAVVAKAQDDNKTVALAASAPQK